MLTREDIIALILICEGVSVAVRDAPRVMAIIAKLQAMALETEKPG